MIRVELLGRQERSPWPKALLAVLVVCGGLYGVHHFFPALTGSFSALIAAAQREAISNPVEETDPKPATQQEVARSATVQREETPSPEPETASSSVVQPEATPRPDPTPSQAPSLQRSTA